MAVNIQKDFTPEVRSKVIGGTDAGTIAGYNRWMDPHDLYLLKKGLIPPPEENTAMKVGTTLEPVVADMYQERIGPDYHLVEPDRAFIHSEHNFLVGHLDRLVCRSNIPADELSQVVRGLEIKTTSPFNLEEWGSEYSDEVPRMYFIQVMHYMAITGLDHFDLAVLIGNSAYRSYRIHRDDSVINGLIELELDFWEKLQRGTPPEVGSSKKSAEYLNSLYPKDSGVEMQVNPEEDKEVYGFIVSLAEAQAEKKKWEGAEQGWKNKIMNYMGDASRLVCPIGSISWKKSKDRENVNWPKLAADLEIDAETVAKYTETKPGPRTFRPNLKLEGVK